MHVRLSRTPEPKQMRVSWTSGSDVSPLVQFGSSPTSLTHTRAATVVPPYTPQEVCGEPARTMGWWDPGFALTAELDLTGEAGVTVYYRVSSNGVQSAVHSFRIAGVGPERTVAAVLTADMGATTPDHIAQHWAEGDAFLTTANMASLAEHGFDGTAVDLAFNVGDLSYATGYLAKWETFMNAVSPVTSRVPYMVTQGNHEQVSSIVGDNTSVW
eukprot:SAG31_NODE_1823_length_7191_cov_9.623519_6_plen_214_part_00